MRREAHEVWAPSLGASGTVVVYGHWGRPVLVFPSEQGRVWDFENNGMVAAVEDLVDDGRVKLYCVDANDQMSWSNRSVPLEERARHHEAYEQWVVDEVVPRVHDDCGGVEDIITLGASMGAYHALNFAFKRADVFPLAMCLSGNFDPASWHGWGERGQAMYFNNPSDYVRHLHGDHLAWLQSRLSVLLVVGQGAWEVHPTGALPSTQHMAGLLADKGIRSELDVWGDDSPHDWSSWARQLRKHLPRFC
jgi:esterase/lipase superfamily enzyme